MKIKNLAIFALTASISFNSDALGVDSLIKLMDNTQDTFTVSNNDGYRQFVNLMISDVKIIDGELSQIPYNKDNIADWTLEARPNKLILDNGQSKKFSVRYIGEVQRKQDKVYAINVIPTPYYAENEAPNNTVQMVIGVAPYVIIPASIDAPLRYSVKYSKEYIEVTNLGGTYFNANVKACDSVELKVPVKECISTSYVLSGREIKIPLPERTNKGNVEVSFRTNNNTYKETFELTLGQLKKQ
ncbi:hypothetical protein [Vibrio sp. AND4]|uniref:hypothetical protein n=1 Tax=Vibrio sp. AND4 TaxID=314289 RepID=UPI00015F2F0A|nr:hypothetical protein [Vibrio sp. AND4]EDP60391.1 hypothetical protein AND4_05724 [Vibrio sp. AND4]